MSGSAARVQARIAGLLYLIVIVTGGFAEFFARASLIVRGDAAATAANILKSEAMFRLGIVADLVGTASYIAVTMLLYYLLKPVSRKLSLLAAFFSLTGCAVLAANLINHIAPLLLLKGAPYLNAFAPAQLQALALTALRLHGWGYNLSISFFGVYCVLLGYLVFRSTYLPRIVGILLTLAGLGHLFNSFANFLGMTLPDIWSSLYAIIGLAGEGSLALWLFLAGLNVSRWNEHASAGAKPALHAT